jgi:uncharacterized protein YbjT (DUF2867 family)
MPDEPLTSERMTDDGHTLTTMVAGSTGLVGSELLQLLLEDPAVGRVHSLVRRATGREHPALVEHVIDFDRLPGVAMPSSVDEVYCCLGTTMRAAGSRAAFRRVDHDHVVALGRLAAAAGARSLAVVSSVGADPSARSFYLRTKGETERDLEALGLPLLVILRPSLLLGPRREFRIGEWVGGVAFRVVGPLLRGSLARYRPIHAHTVARAMVGASREAEPGVRVLESPEIRRLGGHSAIGDFFCL